MEGFLICLAVFLVCFYLLIRDFVKRMKGCPSEERDARFMRAPASKAGILFRSTEQIRKDHPELPSCETYGDLLTLIRRAY